MARFHFGDRVLTCMQVARLTRISTEPCGILRSSDGAALAPSLVTLTLLLLPLSLPCLVLARVRPFRGVRSTKKELLVKRFKMFPSSGGNSPLRDASRARVQPPNCKNITTWIGSDWDARPVFKSSIWKHVPRPLGI